MSYTRCQYRRRLKQLTPILANSRAAISSPPFDPQSPTLSPQLPPITPCFFIAWVAVTNFEYWEERMIVYVIMSKQTLTSVIWHFILCFVAVWCNEKNIFSLITIHIWILRYITFLSCLQNWLFPIKTFSYMILNILQ